MQACVGIYACTYTSFSVFRVQIDLESFVLGYSARSDDLLCNLCGGGGRIHCTDYCNIYLKFISIYLEVCRNKSVRDVIRMILFIYHNLMKTKYFLSTFY